ncbi:MAG: hypothetical protein ACOY46_01830 [Bacillota bacterium]
MTTAQLAGKIKLGPYSDSWDSVNFPSRSSTGKTKSANTRTTVDTLSGGSLAEAVTGYLEKEDTLSDKVLGYGICGFTLFYLVAQVARVIL